MNDMLIKCANIKRANVRVSLTFAIYTYAGQIDPQGYEFICNFVKYGDKKISFGDFS